MPNLITPFPNNSYIENTGPQAGLLRDRLEIEKSERYGESVLDSSSDFISGWCPKLPAGTPTIPCERN